MLKKFASRKFLLSVAAFLGTFCAGVAGVIPPEWCAVGMAASAGLYAACEAYVDGKAATQTTVSTDTKVSATASGTQAQAVIDATIPKTNE